uniref:ChbG/HpnK family deacetylase n=1 Tax=Paenibacillus vini TaxID=1476024 RepID=UPI00357156DB
MKKTGIRLNPSDDFGLSPGVNQGIIEAYQAGGISSTTVMVNMPGFTDAVRLASLHPVNI